MSGRPRIGVILPHADLSGDPDELTTYGQEVERLGFSHIAAFDHVVGADPVVHQPWHAPYDIDTVIHEPFVTFGFLAAVRPRTRGSAGSGMDGSRPCLRGRHWTQPSRSSSRPPQALAAIRPASAWRAACG
ncbi:hypothetical protein GCM10017774_13010 [Lentzea cavernae]|uniref:Luciferase-like monooxygenase n=1 Tax=Lentzea cavernae TaxID=2020703 RepID=A0ABQ3MCR2_9PSEU|nr:hypothetical protein GCM10017774_13010 [Lentzea cavernae]